LADKCSSCTTSGLNEAFLDSTVTTYKKCVKTCPSGTFANTINHLCDTCDTNCLTCSGTTANCLSCKTGGWGWLNYICYNPCPTVYFLSGNNCTACNILCTTCTSALVSACSVCASNAYLNGTTCYTVCPGGLYGDNNAGAGPNLCKPCHANCTSCTGPTNTTCTACLAPNVLNGMSCTSTACAAGYGLTTDSSKCILCSVYCIVCF